jgi:predicted metal-dependent enzyme (double-stranded beta helix superfamily)
MKSCFLIFLIFLVACTYTNEEINATNDVKKEANLTNPDSLDAVVAAPNSHIVLLENEDVRVLRVIINPGEKEPMHTHQWKSVMYVEQASRIRYYNEKNEVVFESPENQTFDGKPEPNWMEPEGIHAVENIDTVPFSALRIELKKP